MRFLILFLLFPGLNVAHAQNSLLASGPMAGYHTETSVTLWAQTREAASVSVRYWPESDSQDVTQSPFVFTQKSEAFTAHLTLSGLTPATRYGYTLLLNEKVVSLPYLTTFFTKNPQPAYDFRVMTGSCAYITDEQFKSDQRFLKFGGRYDIFEKMADQKADYMFWLGDNIYLRDGDWNSMAQIHYRYTHTRSFPTMQRLLATGQHFAIWDDHDFGPNDGDGTWQLKDSSLKAFHQFWANPVPQGSGGIYTRYRIADVEFFLLDVRYFRDPAKDPDTKNKAYLGKEQMDWLIKSLHQSDATFKILAAGNQVISDCNLGEGYCSQYEDEWQLLMARLADANISGLVFLSGDKHYAEISRYDLPGLYPVYDITFSPMTSFPTPFKLRNNRRIRGTFYKRRNFGMLSFEGKGEHRHIRVSLYSFNGKKKWERIIWAKALK